MSQARGAQEPTMEEILSSIRRIISEDGKRGPDGAPEAPPAAAPDAEPAPPVTLRDMPPAADADDVLELTEVAPEESADPEPLELVEEVTAPTLPEPAPAPAAAPEAPAVLEPMPEPPPIPAAAPVPPAVAVPPPLRAALAPVPEPELEPEPPSSLPPEPQPEPAPEPESEAQIEIQAEPEPEPEPDVKDNLEPLEISVAPPAPAPRPQPSMAGGSRFMSEATEIASSAALSVLAQVVQPGRGFTEEGRRMVDQVIRERLEVHLRDWMDANLSGLVERIVREEITGLVERSLGRPS